MKIIEKFPFCKEMETAVEEGRKVVTSRGDQYGEPGDLFMVNGRWYRLLDVHLNPLQVIKDHLYLLEGCTTPDEFEALWRRLHRGHFNPDKSYYSHYFAPCALPDQKDDTETLLALMQNVREILYQGRVTRHLKQSTLMERTGISQSMISRIESDTVNYRVSTLVKLLTGICEGPEPEPPHPDEEGVHA